MYKVVIAVFLSVLSLRAECQIHFEEGSFASVLEKARQKKQMVFLDCYTSWCGPCRQMLKDVFSLDEVGQFMNAHFVNFKLDMEKGEGPELAKKYKVQVYPTFLILDGNGEIIHQMVGGMKAEEFLQNVQDGIGERALYTYEKRYAGGERNPHFMYEYIEKLSKAFMTERMECVLHEYWGALTEREKSGRENWALIKRFVNNPSLPEYEYLLNHKEDFYSVLGKEEVDQKIYADLYPLIANNCNEMIFNGKADASQLLELYRNWIAVSAVERGEYLVDIVDFTEAFLVGDLKKALKMYDKKFAIWDNDARFSATLQLNCMLLCKGDTRICKRGLDSILKTMKDCGWSEENPIFASVISGLKNKLKDKK